MEQAKTSLVRFWRALTVLCVAGVLMGATQAQAGEWVARYEPVSGTSGGSVTLNRQLSVDGPLVVEGFSFDWMQKKYTDAPNDYLKSYPADTSYPKPSASLGSASGTSACNAAQASSSGQVRVVWYWLPKSDGSENQSGPGPVPPSLTFRVTGSSQAAASNKIDDANRDRSGEEGTVTVDVDGAQQRLTSPDPRTSPTLSRWSATAAHLYTKETKGQARVEGPSVSLSAKANITGGRVRYSYPYANTPDANRPPNWQDFKIPTYYSGSVAASNSVTAALDSRTLTIVGSIGQSFQKSPSPEPVAAGMPTPASIPGYNPPMWRVPVKPQSDGSWIVDSSAQWSSHGAQMDLTPQWVGPVGVYANASNFSTRTYLWTISGGTPIIDPPQTDPDFLKRDTITFGSSQPDTGVAASRRLQLSTKNDDSDFTQATTFNVTVTDADGTVGKALPYGVIWHVPYEWNTSQKAMSHWESAEAISVPVPEANWQGSIQGNWKWKTMSAGELPTAQDYYIDATKEATGTITDALGISADKTVDGAIDSVKDVRLHLMLKLGKKLGQTYAGDLMEQWAPSDQTRNASFQSMWALTSSDLKFPGSVWQNANGKPALRPDIDWNLIQNGPYPNDPNQQAAFDANLKLAQPWKVKDPVLHVNKDRYLYRGDGYDGHGFTGACYGAIDVFKPEPFVTGTFVTSAPTLTPTLPPAG